MVLKIKRMALLCVLTTFLATLTLACEMKRHKNFAFTEPQIQIDKGVVYSKLRGHMHSSGTESVHGSPYELIICFILEDSEMVNSCSVSLNKLSLENLETVDAIPLPKFIKAASKKNYKNEFKVRFAFKNLNLLYADHQLKFTLTYGDNCGFETLSDTLTIDFDKKYSEENISFWDVLMGV